MNTTAHLIRPARTCPCCLDHNTEAGVKYMYEACMAAGSDEWALHKKGGMRLKPLHPLTFGKEEHTATLTVFAMGLDATAAFMKQTGDRKITVTLHWDESVLFHRELIEDQLRIPLHHSTLVVWHAAVPAGLSPLFILDPRRTMAESAAISQQQLLRIQKPMIAVSLMSMMDAARELQKRPSLTMEWRRKTPREKNLQHEGSYQEIATVCYNLRRPFPEIHSADDWRSYHLERHSLLRKQRIRSALEDVYEPPIDFVRHHIRTFPFQIMVESGVKKVQAETLSDGIMLIGKGFRAQGLDNVISVLSRIYTPHSFDSIEVGFDSSTRDGVSVSNSMGVRIVRAGERGTTRTEWHQMHDAKPFSKFASKNNGWESVAWSFRTRKESREGNRKREELAESFDLTLDVLEQLRLLLNLKGDDRTGTGSYEGLDPLSVTKKLFEERKLVIDFLRAACCADWDERWPTTPGGRSFSVNWGAVTPNFWERSVERLLRGSEMTSAEGESGDS